jgi:hypothetical protein
MWRRTLSDPALLAGNDPALILRSAEALEARRAA